MAVKIFDTMTTATPNFPLAYAEKINIVKNDGTEDNLQNLFNAGELGGGDSSIVLSQAEYDALSDEEKMSDQEYQCYDTGRIYRLDVVFGDKKPVTLTFEEYKALEEAGSVEADVDYIIVGNESGALLSDLDIEHGTTGTTSYEVIETLKSDVENLIDDTNLTSTTSTVSASKVKNAITYSFDTQSGNVKYVKFKPSITTISVIDIYGGKIEILGASKAAANPSYKTVKVVRLSYGDWGSYDATQVPSVVHTKIGELYYYPTDEYYYLKFYNYAAFTMTGLTTAPEIITSLPAEESAMTLIPESDWGKIDDTSSSTESTWSSSKITSEITSTYLIKDIAAGGENEKTVSFKIRKDYFASYYAKRTFLLSANIYSLGFSKPVISLVEIFRSSADNYSGYVVNLQDTRYTGVTVTVNGDYLEVDVTFNSYESSGCMVSCSSLSNVPIA